MNEQLINIEIISYKKNVIFKIIIVILTVVIALLLGSMLGGTTGSGNTLFKRLDVPAWGYFVTSIILIMIMIFTFNLVISWNSISGIIKVFDNYIIIQRKKYERKIYLNEIKIFEIIPDYVSTSLSPSKLCRKIKISTETKTYLFDVNLSSEEEEIINKSIFQNKSN
jgi:hypothetical protein